MGAEGVGEQAFSNYLSIEPNRFSHRYKVCVKENYYFIPNLMKLDHFKK